MQVVNVFSTTMFVGKHVELNPAVQKKEVSIKAKVDYYVRTLVKSVQNAFQRMPSWQVWIYIDETTPTTLTDLVREYSNVVIKRVNNFPTEAMVLSRFIPLGDKTLGTVIVFDADGLLNENVFDLVESFHDAYFGQEYLFLYNTEGTIMASLVGTKASTNREVFGGMLNDYIQDQSNLIEWQRDEIFLDQVFALVDHNKISRFEWSVEFSGKYLVGTGASMRAIKENVTKHKKNMKRKQAGEDETKKDLKQTEDETKKDLKQT
jgi:hypothetical protein